MLGEFALGATLLILLATPLGLIFLLHRMSERCEKANERVNRWAQDARAYQGTGEEWHRIADSRADTIEVLEGRLDELRKLVKPDQPKVPG